MEKSHSYEKLYFKSISIFDTDLAYGYADSLLEVDGLLTIQNISGLMVHEDLSHIKDEWHKAFYRLFLGPSFPPTLWSNVDNIEKLGFHALWLNRVKTKENKAVEDLLKSAYIYASELVNVMFYSLLFFAPKAFKTIITDIRHSYEIHENVMTNKQNSLALISLILRKFSSYDKALERKERKIKIILEQTEGLLIYPQLGTGEYSAKGLAQTIKLMLDNNLMPKLKFILIAYNESSERTKSEGRLVFNKIKEILSKNNTIRVGVLNVDETDRLKELCQKHNYIVALIMQDYGKKYLEELYNVLITNENNGLKAILILPESFYVIKKGNRGRNVEAIGPFLSKIRHCKYYKLLSLLSLKTIIIDKGDLYEK